MSENLTSNNNTNDDLNLNTDESDYEDLINKVREIKKIISLLEKTILT